mmetsp:Transcript_21898/g.70498  ORF Transcript_21898/g.70498 Transcript_21898/m.70498 type:complete len:222 (+) Transcript_21898:1760-2425(+)
MLLLWACCQKSQQASSTTTPVFEPPRMARSFLLNSAGFSPDQQDSRLSCVFVAPVAFEFRHFVVITTSVAMISWPFRTVRQNLYLPLNSVMTTSRSRRMSPQSRLRSSTRPPQANAAFVFTPWPSQSRSQRRIYSIVLISIRYAISLPNLPSMLPSKKASKPPVPNSSRSVSKFSPHAVLLPVLSLCRRMFAAGHIGWRSSQVRPSHTLNPVEVVALVAHR